MKEFYAEEVRFETASAVETIRRALAFARYARADILGCNVSTCDHTAERWQGAPVLEHRRESAPAW